MRVCNGKRPVYGPCALISLASPKSAIFVTSLFRTRIFSGFISRWK